MVLFVYTVVNVYPHRQSLENQGEIFSFVLHSWSSSVLCLPLTLCRVPFSVWFLKKTWCMKGSE